MNTMSVETGVDSEIATLTEQLTQAVEGDLTVRLDTDLHDETLADLSQSVNELLTELDGALLGFQSFGVQVTTETEQVAGGVDEIQQTSGDVAESIEEITQGVSTQTEKLTAASNELTDLSATVEEIASSADDVATLSADAATNATEGADLAETSMETMSKIETQADSTVERIDTLESEMGEITEIVELIDGIADQTNMLALNASIEAARAGKAGEGFAVVADEVKTLAEETQAATTDIAERVDSIQELTTTTASDIRDMRRTIQSGRDTIEESLSALETIAQQVNEANDGVQSISDATDDQATSTQEVAKMIEDVVSISEQTNTEAKTVSEAAEEQTAAVSQIAESVAELDDLVVDLSSQLNSFEVGDGGEHIALMNADYEAAVTVIEETNGELLRLSDEVVTAYTELPNSSEYPDEINIAGRQRMLSQRIAKQTLSIARNERAGEASDEIQQAKADLESDIEEFQHALDTLADGGTHRGDSLAPAPDAVSDVLATVSDVWQPLRRNAETIVQESRFTDAMKRST